MEKNKVIDRRQVRLDEMMKPGYIPFLGGRPKRETVISWDDCIDLAIALNTAASAEEFIAKM